MGKPPFEQVVTDHGRTVLRVCRAVLGPQDAEDAWAETFLAALRAYPELPADANLEAWLVTVAHRKALDVIRSRVRAPLAVREVPERATQDGDALGRGHPADRDHALWEALAALPPKQRHAVAYHYVVGLPHREVAAITGGSTDAARRAAADGIAALRRALGAAGTKGP